MTLPDGETTAQLEKLLVLMSRLPEDSGFAKNLEILTIGIREFSQQFFLPFITLGIVSGDLASSRH